MNDIKNIINYQDVDMNNTIIKVNDTGTNVKDNWDDSSDEEEEQEQAVAVVVIKEEFIKPAASAVEAKYDYECDDYDDEEEEDDEYDYDELDQYDKKMGRYVTAPVKKR